ncbi:MAG: hypothetical protein GY928_39560 [Colwellia sp.]|nr:hypothetical protein [Colwellia sp.]
MNTIKEVLEFFKFEHREDEYYEGGVIVEESYELSKDAGSLQYLPRLKRLFIWSGVGLGAYVDEEGKTNHVYGFEVKIQDEVHLKNVIATLLYLPPKDVLEDTECEEAYLFEEK